MFGVSSSFIWAASQQNQQNGMHTQRRLISQGIRLVWSESSLSAWRKLGSLATYWAHSEDLSDWVDAQADLSSLGTQPFCYFVMRQLICIQVNNSTVGAVSVMSFRVSLASDFKSGGRRFTPWPRHSTFAVKLHTNKASLTIALSHNPHDDAFFVNRVKIIIIAKL